MGISHFPGLSARENTARCTPEIFSTQMPMKIHRLVLKDTEGHFKLCKYLSFSNQMSCCGFERIIQRLFLLELPCHLVLKWVA